MQRQQTGVWAVQASHQDEVVRMVWPASLSSSGLQTSSPRLREAGAERDKPREIPAIPQSPDQIGFDDGPD